MQGAHTSNAHEGMANLQQALHSHGRICSDLTAMGAPGWLRRVRSHINGAHVNEAGRRASLIAAMLFLSS